MNAIMVCVGYDDFLEVTLPRSAPHFRRILVVSSPEDERTARLVARFPTVELYTTDVFYANGATFNKGAAMEEGFDVLKRRGWICVLDADIVLPPRLSLGALRRDCLHSAQRRMCHVPSLYNGSEDWGKFPLKQDQEHAGFFQLFHASDPAICNSRPWYGVSWKHAGGCDSEFMFRWPASKRRWLNFEVLHLGSDGKNWWGRQTRRMDGVLPTDAEAAHQKTIEMYLRRPKEGQAWEKLSPI